MKAVRAFLLSIALASAAWGQQAETEQKAFLRLEVNGEEKGDVLVVLRGGEVLVRADDLRRAGLHGLGGGREQRHGEEWIPLWSLAPELTFGLDVKGASLRIQSSAKYLEEHRLVLRSNARPKDLVFSSAPSVFLNYAAQTVDGGRPQGFAETGATLGSAFAYTGASIDRNGRLVRGLTSVTVDDPARLRRLVVGDSFSGGSVLGGSPQLLGVSFSREFSLDPYFIAAPHQELRGATITPARVEIYSGDRLVREEQLPPGPFQLVDVPGYGESTRVVVRDAFGRTQEFNVGTQSPAALLAPGLSDFSYQVGVRRTGFGTESFAYGAPALLARHRMGVWQSITLGGHAEAAPGVVNGGPTLTASTPVGSFDLAIAASRAGARTGAAGFASYAIGFPHLSLGADVTWMSGRFANLDLSPEDDRARLSLRLLASTSVGSRVNLTVGYLGSDLRDGARRRRIYGSAVTRLHDRLSFSLETSWEPGGAAEGLSTFAGLTFSLGRTTTTAAMQAARAGASESLVAQMAPPVGEGLGYTLRADSSAPSASADLRYQGAHGIYEARTARAGSSQDWSASAAGGLVLMDGSLFATRPVQGGYALVDAQVPGVRAYMNNQEMGRTDQSGRLLLPEVLPYYGNRFRIDPADLPFDYQIRRVEQTVAGPIRGGALARFQVERVRAFTGHAMAGNLPAPESGELRIGERRFPLGLDGRFYLEGVVPGRHELALAVLGGVCRFSLDFPAAAQPVVDLGRVGCDVVPSQAALVSRRVESHLEGAFEPSQQAYLSGVPGAVELP